MNTLRNLKAGDHVRDAEGNEFDVIEVYNVGNPAQQVLLTGEYYPILVSEMEKLGYQFMHA